MELATRQNDISTSVIILPATTTPIIPKINHETSTAVGMVRVA